MKTVGKQLEEARLARKWTPELASRETKIKVERLLDLESDNFANFSSPAYARGFVRTYARSLGLDEYKILRQLDHKLPDDSAPLSTDSVVTYVPEPTEINSPVKASRLGGNILAVLAAIIVGIGVFVAVQNYRANVLTRSTLPATTPAAEIKTPAEAAPASNSVTEAEPSAPKALPVTLPGTIAPPTDTPAPVALPVDPSTLPGAAVAHPVTPSDSAASPAPDNSTTPSVAAVPAAPALPANPAQSTDPANAAAPRATAVSLADLSAAPAPTSIPVAPLAPPVVLAPALPSTPGKPLQVELIPQGTSFVSVTQVEDGNGSTKLLYAGVLRPGDQPINFSARHLNVNIGVPSAISVLVDGANYSHSSGSSSETFSLQAPAP